MTSTSRGEGTCVRVGVIRGDRLVLERSFTHGETITIGSHAAAALRIPIDETVDPWPLITPKGAGAILRLPSGARGKLARGADVRAVGGGAEIELGRDDRGKVRIGEVTVLFQTTTAQTAVNRPRVDFRGRLLDEEDGLVLGFTSVIGTAATVAIIAARLLLPAEEPEIEPPFERIIWHELRPVAARPAPAPAPIAPPTAKPTPASPPRDPVVASAPAGTASPDPSRPRSAVLEALLTIRTHGAADLPSPSIAAMMHKIPEGYVAKRPDDGSRGPGGPGATVDISGTPDGRDPIHPPGTPTFTPAPDVPIVITYPGPTEPDPTTDVEAIRKVIKGHAGDLKFCYERSAKLRSDLAGRVEVSWEIRGGRAGDVTIDENYTGDDELGTCIANQLGRWSFAGIANTEVTWPFVFKASQ